jgi:hypothetical protein
MSRPLAFAILIPITIALAVLWLIQEPATLANRIHVIWTAASLTSGVITITLRALPMHWTSENRPSWFETLLIAGGMLTAALPGILSVSDQSAGTLITLVATLSFIVGMLAYLRRVGRKRPGQSRPA